MDEIRRLMYKIERFFSKIIRVLEFIKLGWEDEDWDFEYLLKLIEFKCKKMREDFNNSGFLTEENRRDIRIGLNKTLYFIDCYRDSSILYKDMYGEFPLEVSYRSVPCENGLSEMVSVNKKTGEVLSGNKEKQYMDYILKLNELEQLSWEKIFETISEEGQKWWN